jgi:hypothetical protein
MILVANKVDLVHLRQVSQEQGKLLANELKVIFLRFQCASVKLPLLLFRRFHILKQVLKTHQLMLTKHSMK